MLLPVTSQINNNGNISIGGCDLAELKARHKTPLYIIDIKTVKKQCADYLKYFKSGDFESEIIYASKAFCTIAMCQLIKNEGLSLDVSTGGEIFTAVRSGFDPAKIFFHGNNKSEEEIKFALDYNVGTFIVDNFEELKNLDRLANQKGARQKIMIRITPGIKAHTHKYIQTGAIESKFGFNLYRDEAFKAVSEILSLDNIDLIGIHAHIGSQIFNIEVYDRLIETMARFISDVKKKYSISLRHLNIGGGLGIKYIAGDKPASIKDLAELVKDSFNRNKKKYGADIEKIYLEPGRSIIGNAGATLYEVGTIKEIPGVKNYAAVDGGMSDNIRPVLYQAKYDAFIANRPQYLGGLQDGEPINHPGDKKYTIVGKHCESGDIIIEDIMLPSIKKGDLILVAATGAYCYCMASNYNSLPKNAVVAVEDGRDWIWVGRQTYEDLVARDKKLYEN